VGFVLAAEHLAVPLTRDQQGSYSNTQGWLQLSYQRSPRFGANLQLFRSGPERADVFAAADKKDTLSAGLDGRRTDLHATASYAPGGEGPGPRLSLAFAYTSWSEDSTGLALPPPPPVHQHVRLIDQSVMQIGALASHRGAATSLEASAWYRSRWTPLEVRAFGAVAPPGGLVGTLEAVYQRHDGERTSRWLLARAGVALPLRLRLGGMLRVGSAVAAPALASDRAADLSDGAALLAFEHPRLGLEVGYWRTSGSSPQGFSLYREVPALAPTGPATWVTFSGRVAPRQWFILDGWYSDAVGVGPEGQPPTHSIVNATIQSKFLPTFRSGIFGLKLQGSMETWGTGVLGRNAEGEPVPLPGATFFRGLIQLQIGAFTAYYDRVNLRASDLGYVPGLPILRLASTFGVRWEFSN
jgi:hypothetical protein